MGWCNTVLCCTLDSQGLSIWSVPVVLYIMAVLDTRQNNATPPLNKPCLRITKQANLMRNALLYSHTLSGSKD